MQIITGHTSPETAYVVDDYPYGFTLRCKIRYWLEHNPKRGFRFVSQTTNPKRSGEFWNKPKASTYAQVAAAMYLDEKEHVHWTAIPLYKTADETQAWLDTFGGCLSPDVLQRAQNFIAAKRAYEAKRQASDALGQASDTLHPGVVEIRRPFVEG